MFFYETKKLGGVYLGLSITVKIRVFEKCMVLAKETLHPAPWKEFRPQYPSEHVKLEMMLHTSGNFLKEALENGEIDVGTKYEISEFLHDLAFRGYNPGILGQRLASFGVSYLENLSQNPNASLNFRFEAILKILNRYGYNSFSEVAKYKAREALMEIAFGERTPSESRLRAFYHLSQYKDPSAKKKILEEGYPLIERIFLDPLESTEVRKSASEFFTKEGSLYGVSRYDRAPNFYHRPEERAQKDQKILLQVIKDELVSPDLREFLVDKLFTGAFLRYGEKALLLQEVKDTMGVFYMSALPFFNESN